MNHATELTLSTADRAELLRIMAAWRDIAPAGPHRGLRLRALEIVGHLDDTPTAAGGQQ